MIVHNNETKMTTLPTKDFNEIYKRSKRSVRISKREQFAMAAMQGLLAGRNEENSYGRIWEDEAVKLADALLKALESEAE